MTGMLGIVIWADSPGEIRSNKDRTVAALVARGLASVRIDPTDEAKHIVTPTAAGRIHYAEMTGRTVESLDEPRRPIRAYARGRRS